MQPPALVSAPDSLARLKRLVLDSLRSEHSRRAYLQALNDFFGWLQAGPRGPFGRALVQEYRAHLERANLAPSTINMRLSALRKLASESAENGYLDRATAQAVISLKSVRQAGFRAGNWLTREQARALIAQPDAGTLRGKRDRAILALLVCCGLRRTELAGLRAEDIVQREGRWAIVDLPGKGGRLRTVPVPPPVKVAVDAWTSAAGIRSGPLFRSTRAADAGREAPLTGKMIWHLVAKYAAEIGVRDLAPHDLRRTCAKLCRAAGGELEQIQFLLGHASIQTTERYLGSRQNLVQAVNDNLL
jgi:integrase